MKIPQRASIPVNNRGCSIVLIIFLSAAVLLFAALSMGDVMLCVVGTAHSGAIAPECHIASVLLIAITLALLLVTLLLRRTRWDG